jgi:hypothetical protein
MQPSADGAQEERAAGTIPTHQEFGHDRETKSGGHRVRQIDYAQVQASRVNIGFENLQLRA